MTIRTIFILTVRGSTLDVRIRRLQTSDFDVQSRFPRCKGQRPKGVCFRFEISINAAGATRALVASSKKKKSVVVFQINNSQHLIGVISVPSLNDK